MLYAERQSRIFVCAFLNSCFLPRRPQWKKHKNLPGYPRRPVEVVVATFLAVASAPGQVVRQVVHDVVVDLERAAAEAPLVVLDVGAYFAWKWILRNLGCVRSGN